MPTPSYDYKRGRWDISYKTPEGRYARKRIKDDNYPRLGRREQERVRARMQALADSLATPGNQTPALPKTLAQVFLTANPPTHSRRPKTVKAFQRALERFGRWLESNHPSLSLSQNEHLGSILSDYGAYLSEGVGLCSESVSQELIKINATLRANKLPVVDCSELVEALRASEDCFRRELVYVQDYEWLARRHLDGSVKGINMFALYYFGIVTGWRKGDLVNKMLSDISMERGTIRNIHTKTRRTTGLTTTLPITNFGMELLRILSEVNPKDSPYLLYFGRRLRGCNRPEEQRRLSYAQHQCEVDFAHLMKVRGIQRMQRAKHKQSTLSFHSLRGTMLSHLVNSGFSESLGRSMAGHSPERSVERKHYFHFTPDDYLPCVEAIENDYIIPSVRKLKELRGFAGRLHDCASRYEFPQRKGRDKILWRKIHNKLKSNGFEEWLESSEVTISDLRFYFGL